MTLTDRTRERVPDADRPARDSFEALVEGTASALAELGVGISDTVAVKLGSGIERTVVRDAAARLGARVRVVDPALTPAETALAVRGAAPSLVVAERGADLARLFEGSVVAVAVTVDTVLPGAA